MALSNRKLTKEDLERVGGSGGVGATLDGQTVIVDTEGTTQTASATGEIFNDYRERTLSTGQYPVVMKTGNVATGEYSHAEGSITTATGVAAHAEGYNCKATGEYAHAEGMSCEATGRAAHAEGHNCKATGEYAHAEGMSCEATGRAAHARGQGTIASGPFQFVTGRYNEELPNLTDRIYYIIVGNGDSSSNRSNAFTLKQTGEGWFAGTVECTGVIVSSSTEGSTKRFKLTVDDSGAIAATEVT